MYDIIGDMHGHADELKALLNKLGYTESKGTYSCPGRKVIFVWGLYRPKANQILNRRIVCLGKSNYAVHNHNYT